MRIAIVSPYTVPFYCGNSLMADRLRIELSSRGHRVCVFNSSRDAQKDARDFSPDIIHSLHAVKNYDWLEKFCSDSPVPLVVTLTGTDYNVSLNENGFLETMSRSLARAAAIVVFHDEAFSLVSSGFRDMSKKIHIIAQGVRCAASSSEITSHRPFRGLRNGEVVFLMIAGIRPVKNIGYALDAFSGIAGQVPEARLVLVGPVIDEAEGKRVLTA